MKTVGQLLHSARNRQNISLEELSRETKIDKKYIEALETDSYDKLPSETFIKGFIRNLSLNLDSDPEEMIAVFRRDYKHPEISTKKSISSRGVNFKLPHLSSNFYLIALGITAFVVYLGFQFRSILTPPPLLISIPQPGTVLTSPVEIVGTTSPDSYLTINNDQIHKPEQNGVIKTQVNLSVGETVLVIKTTNRFGRTQSVEIPLTIISN